MKNLESAVSGHGREVVEFSGDDAGEDVEFDNDDAGEEIGDKDPSEDAEFGNDDAFVPYAPVSP